MILNIIKITYARIRFFIASIIFKGKLDDSTDLSVDISKVVKNLEEEGIYIIDNFIDKEICKKIIKSFDEGINTYKDDLRVDRNRCDFRMFGSENLCI